MNSAANTAKWLGVLVLHFPLYLVISYVMRSLLGDGYFVLIKAGANLQQNLLLQHFLIVSLIDGFLAGLIGVAIVRAMLLLPIKIQVANGPAWKRPQAWTWTVSSCWFVVGVFVWAIANGHPSVLTTSSSRSLSDLVDVFFGSGCDLSAHSIDSSIWQGCMTQISFTHPWLGTIGYSAAAFIPMGWKNRLYNSPDLAEESEDFNEEQPSRSGEALN